MREILKMKKTYMGNKLNSESLDKSKTAVIVVDMINGFVNIGNFASDRVKIMSPNIVVLLGKFKGSRRVFFRDIHEEGSKEFNAYVEHCVDLEETEIIEELKEYAYGEYSNGLATIVAKNSTNGFLTTGFRDWLKENNDIENFIVVGCVTDICVSDFAKTLQCYIYENNLDKQVIVPINCVETYDYDHHNAELMNVFALYSMNLGGIKIVDEII